MVFHNLKVFLIFILLTCLTSSMGARKSDILLRVLNYPASIHNSCGTKADTFQTNVYTKYHIQTLRRNPFMMIMPHLFHVSRGEQRLFFGETYSTVIATEKQEIQRFRHLHISTIRHRRKTLDILNQYLNPHIYGVTLVGNHLLSPFHSANCHFYKYYFDTDSSSTHTRLTFRPKIQNTQLVTGEAVIETQTGRIKECHIKGEYDMTAFMLHIRMGEEDLASLRATYCEIEADLSIIGNRLHTRFTAVSDLPVQLPRTIADADSLSLMNKLRPIPLSQTDSQALQYYDNLQVRQSNDTTSTGTKTNNKWHTADAIWDAIDDNLLTSISGRFGDNKQHYFKISPLFNPLYMGYSNSRGITYKLKANFEYRPSENTAFSLFPVAGYSFRQHQLYFTAPFQYSFNRRREGYVSLTIANGNTISNSQLMEQVKQEHRLDSIRFDRMDLQYFRDLSFQVKCNYAPNPHLSAQVGVVFHRRSAVSHHSFHVIGKPDVYKNFGTLVSCTYHPWKTHTIFHADYEHGFRGPMSGDASYDRIETDFSHTFSFPCTRTLKLRTGIGGIISYRGENYFLDYTTFRRNHISDSWHDEWSGNYELLDEHWYNASNYYVQLNAAYESPLLFLSRLPLLGKIIERERIVLNTLAIRRLAPYIECGYGMTNRYFSIGGYAAFSRRGYESCGIKLGFELFNNW